jgi:hypothetical protein
MRRATLVWGFAAAAVVVAVGCASLEDQAADKIEYLLASAQAAPDEIVKFDVRLPASVRTGRVTFLQRTYPFYARADVDDPVFTTLLPVPYGTPPGEHPLACTFEVKGAQRTVHESLSFRVLPGPAAPGEERVVAKGFDARAYARELQQVNELLRHPAYLAERLPVFLLPQGGSIKTAFGTWRTYNGRDRVRIEGIEIEPVTHGAADVTAAADGRVALAQKLPMLGNTVVLDHGFAFATLYANLRDLDVKTGQTVRRGAALGRVGRTGASAVGTRLRYQLFVAGVPVNVQKVLALHQFR